MAQTELRTLGTADEPYDLDADGGWHPGGEGDGPTGRAFPLGVALFLLVASGVLVAVGAARQAAGLVVVALVVGVLGAALVAGLWVRERR